MVRFLVPGWEQMQAQTQEERERQEELLAVRIRDVIAGSRRSYQFPYRKPNGNWQLDAGNDWFFSMGEGSGEIRYRYNKPAEFWAALQIVLEHLL